MTGLGFALGPTIQRFVDSLVFVLAVAPYDVGDRVQISGIMGNATLLVIQSKPESRLCGPAAAMSRTC